MERDVPNSRHIVISGCSGGGKSTLLAELARRGCATVPEPGRRIVQEELRKGGDALPWIDLGAFARRALQIAARDRETASKLPGPTFFDRGLVDAAVALHSATGIPLEETLSAFPPYDRTVFLAPPWPEIYVMDAERPLAFKEAVAEYERLLTAYRELGYDAVILPKSATAARADLVCVVERLSRGRDSRLHRLTEIAVAAIETFGSPEAALRFLEEPAMALDRRLPLDLMSTAEGAELVERHLKRLGSGVYT